MHLLIFGVNNQVGLRKTTNLIHWENHKTIIIFLIKKGSQCSLKSSKTLESVEQLLNDN